jgi:branched-chain amino acid transport system substrate-binding protein
LIKKEESMMRLGISRRPAILLTFGLVFAALASWTHGAFAQGSTPIRIGLLHSTTGPFAPQGADLNEGFRAYMTEVGYQVAGRKIELLTEDDESKVDSGITKTKKLVEREKVDILVGPVASAVAFAIRDYVHQNQVPTVITMATANDITRGKAGPYFFRVSFASDQLTLPAGWYAAKKLGYKRAIILALDFAPGRDQANAFMKTFKEAGGTIVSEIYPPLGNTDWGPYIAQLRRDMDHADVVVPIVYAGDAIRFVKALAEYGLKDKKPILAQGQMVDEAFLPSMGDAALGIQSWLYYSPVLETPENQRFRDVMKKQYNREPSSANETGYVTAKAIALALQKVNGRVDDRPAFLAALRQVQFEAPQGLFRFDDRQNAIFDLYIRRVDKVGGKLVNTVIDKIPNVSQNWTRPD